MKKLLPQTSRSGPSKSSTASRMRGFRISSLAHLKTRCGLLRKGVPHYQPVHGLERLDLLTVSSRLGFRNYAQRKVVAIAFECLYLRLRKGLADLRCRYGFGLRDAHENCSCLKKSRRDLEGPCDPITAPGKSGELIALLAHPDSIKALARGQVQQVGIRTATETDVGRHFGAGGDMASSLPCGLIT